MAANHDLLNASAATAPPTSITLLWCFTRDLRRGRDLGLRLFDDLGGRDLHPWLQVVNGCGFALDHELERLRDLVLLVLAVFERQDNIVTLRVPHGTVERARRALRDIRRGFNDCSCENCAGLEVADMLRLSVDDELTTGLHFEQAVISEGLHLGEQ